MSEVFDPDRAASILAEAWRSGSLMKELPEAVRPQTMAQGYDIQDRLMAQMGHASVGWKLGIGSLAQKRDFGVGRLVAGRIPANALYRDGETVELPNAAPVTVEFEIAYVLGCDILPDEPTFPVLDAVSETRVSFELVLSRFIDRRAVGWPSFAADNGACQAVVLGDAIELSEIPALIESLIVFVDGEERVRAVAGDDVTDPAGALADLVTVARERGMLLPKGSIISTGTVSRPFNIAASSAHISARYLKHSEVGRSPRDRLYRSDYYSGDCLLPGQGRRGPPRRIIASTDGGRPGGRFPASRDRRFCPEGIRCRCPYRDAVHFCNPVLLRRATGRDF